MTTTKFWDGSHPDVDAIAAKTCDDAVKLTAAAPSGLLYVGWVPTIASSFKGP